MMTCPPLARRAATVTNGRRGRARRWRAAAALLLLALQPGASCAHPRPPDVPTADRPIGEAAPVDPTPTVNDRLIALRASVASARQAAPSLAFVLQTPRAVAPLLSAMVHEDLALDRAARAPDDPTWGPALRRAWRQEVDELAAALRADHAAALALLLDRYGWFDVGRFGSAADQDAWILVQRADLDAELQQRALRLMEEAVAAGQTDPRRFALLYDRLRVRQGRPQRYGTQGRCVAGGRWEPYPLEQPALVDRLRADVGLGSVRAHQARLSSTCPGGQGELGQRR